MQTFIIDAVNYNLTDLRDIDAVAKQLEDIYGHASFIDYINAELVCNDVIVSFFTDHFYQLIDFLY
jgi:hypothetical protein